MFCSIKIERKKVVDKCAQARERFVKKFGETLHGCSIFLFSLFISNRTNNFCAVSIKMKKFSILIKFFEKTLRKTYSHYSR